MLQLKSILDRLGLRQYELAALIDVNPRTVSLWSTGRASVPGPVAAYLRVLLAAGPALIREELSSLHQRSLRLDEGIYALSYRTPDGSGCGSGLAVLRNGQIMGSDRDGGTFTGSYEFDAATSLNRVHLRLNAPRNSVLVTGQTVGSHGTTLDIVGEFQRANPVSMVTVDVAGAPVDVEIGYLGPLPN